MGWTARRKEQKRVAMMSRAATKPECRTKVVPPLIATLLLSLLVAPAALAQSAIPGSYAPFSVTLMKSGIAPPLGTVVLENGSVFYDNRRFIDSAGNKLRVSPTDAFVNRTTFGYVPDIEVLGASFYPAAFVMFMDQTIRPVPGSNKELQLADLVVQPIALGWHFDEWHALTSYNLWLPTGRFVAGASNNTGKGLYSHMFSGAVTWLEDAALPWMATGQVRYEFFGKQKTTNIRPAQVTTLEMAFGKEVFTGIDIGIAGAYSFQTTRETGSAPGTDISRYRYASIGPEIHWRPRFLPGAQVSFRPSFEFAARNTSQGIGALLSFVYSF